MDNLFNFQKIEPLFKNEGTCKKNEYIIENMSIVA
ncbi:hypothetical protein Clocel_3057 [Clostridium cellulovorans 743B]|uniref:Uncharacterized protein n=1 Tax=Clostridium cellulovorans (strain ATCC 35296 / DSM 3052 / OCM 3 / 743B) TaxID=573061 RepID=D9STL3_CLOC7|nr:hypothetical protein Clocel_3057 [Clostridium cellulovorans 743B]